MKDIFQKANQNSLLYVFTLCSCLFLLSGCPSGGSTVKNNTNGTKTTATNSKKWKLLKGSPAPAFSLRGMKGRLHSLKKYKGKVVLVNFWATWCGPCKKEMVHFNKMYTKYKAKGFIVLAISGDEPNQAAQIGPIISRYGYKFPVMHDKDGRIFERYYPQRNFPFTALIDRKGQMRITHQGYNPGDEKVMEKHVQELLKEKP